MESHGQDTGNCVFEEAKQLSFQQSASVTTSFKSKLWYRVWWCLVRLGDVWSSERVRLRNRWFYLRNIHVPSSTSGQPLCHPVVKCENVKFQNWHRHRRSSGRKFVSDRLSVCLSVSKCLSVCLFISVCSWVSVLYLCVASSIVPWCAWTVSGWVGLQGIAGTLVSQCSVAGTLVSLVSQCHRVLQQLKCTVWRAVWRWQWSPSVTSPCLESRRCSPIKSFMMISIY